MCYVASSPVCPSPVNILYRLSRLPLLDYGVSQKLNFQSFLIDLYLLVQYCTRVQVCSTCALLEPSPSPPAHKLYLDPTDLVTCRRGSDPLIGTRWTQVPNYASVGF